MVRYIGRSIEYKLEAIRLWQSSDKTAAQVEDEPGLRCMSLYEWKPYPSRTFRMLLAFTLIFAIWLISACAPTEGVGTAEPVAVESPTAQITGTATPAVPTETPTPAGSTEQVELRVSKTVYQLGEPVPITITNNLNREIFFQGGPAAVVGTKRIPLIRMDDITEDVDPPGRLSAGETISGAWDQVAFWAPEKEGLERFQDWTTRENVPPGLYQYRMHYGFTEETFRENIIYSDVFTIVE